MMSVLVVGAGIAGLTAAWRLQEAGFEVSVAEAGPAVGGRMAERRDGEIAYNSGARLIYRFGHALPDLIRDLGLADALIELRDLSAACHAGGRDYRLALMPGLAALRTPGLTMSDRARLTTFALRLARLRAGTDPDDLASAGPDDAETLAAFADRVLGKRVRALLIDPLFRGTRSWDPSEISAAFLLTTLPHMLGGRSVAVFAGGMGRLPRELAARLEVRVRTEVAAIARLPRGGCLTRFADGSMRQTDLVVVATEGARAAALLAPIEPEEARFFATVRYNSLGIVHYALQGDVDPLLRFIDRAEGSTLATFQQLPAAPDAGRPRAQLYCQLTPEATRAAREGRRTSALAGMIHADVCRLFPDLDRRVIAHTEQWIEHKLPMPMPGSIADLTRFRAWQEGAPHRVYFCGDYLAQALVTGACASGAATARLIARHWPRRVAGARAQVPHGGASATVP
jgi:oxygen-dependent protoporphyrinogen oxidase